MSLKVEIDHQPDCRTQILHLHQVGARQYRPHALTRPIEGDLQISQPPDHPLTMLGAQVARPDAIAEKPMHEEIALFLDPFQIRQIAGVDIMT